MNLLWDYANGLLLRPRRDSAVALTGTLRLHLGIWAGLPVPAGTPSEQPATTEADGVILILGGFTREVCILTPQDP